MKKKGLFFKLFGQAVKDKSPEEIEQLAMDAAAAFDEEGEAPKKEEAEEKPPEKKEAEDESAIDGIVDKVLARIAAKEAEKSAKDSLDAVIEELTRDSGENTPGAEAADKEASRVIPAEGEKEDKGSMDKALAAEILKAMRPSVAAIKDEAQRKAVSDALINLVTAQDGRDDVAAILRTSQKNAQTAADNRPKAMDTDAIQALYDNLNPHKRKETK